MKITVIGGGSTYTPELVNGFLAASASLPLKELCLMDIDKERLDVVGGFAQRMTKAKGEPFKVTLSLDQRAAIAGASYVVTQLRVGQMFARRGDEYLGRRHGLIGQETTGVGGMAKALRTIPIILDIAKDIRETTPGALLANFTNPAGLVTEALTRYASDVPAVGVCNVGITTKMGILDELEKATGSRVDSERAVLNTLGLNHLTWHRGFTIDGEEMWPMIFPAYVESLKEESEPEWDARTVESLGMIPNYYLQYFYYTEKKFEAQKKWPPSRAEEVMEIEKDLLREYADPNLTEPPADLMKRGGAYYSTLATQLINSHHNDLGQVHVVNVRNNDAVKEWPADWVLELPAKVDRRGVHPLPAAPLPPACFGLIAQVKMYELLTVEAAVHGDRNALYQALLAHPLGPSADKVQEVMDDVLETNRQWLPQFERG
ncbi:MAG: 6-phospho-beta-glucosidase [Anaerolineaceae bacterium]|nr:6-phospho-beta-glucosidase [Anaerolineae bacterium]MBL1171725.1 6-phospho-beta-glucosidase [Chloroflexota bacterium]MDL1926740.1 6-phospho-beta-glucosidase [Anaerolineae bacterium AMX1]WKZ53621.1 MAG: 6-phospho-beta-glucosidase [Anaerolineales bacterium]GJQ37914.1 MAG: 6-phospho-beta-glucosidase [Anaerolineaceae bacterium]